jgi:hypothetical protein
MAGLLSWETSGGDLTPAKVQPEPLFGKGGGFLPLPRWWMDAA